MNQREDAINKPRSIAERVKRQAGVMRPAVSSARRMDPAASRSDSPGILNGSRSLTGCSVMLHRAEIVGGP